MSAPAQPIITDKEQCGILEQAKKKIENLQNLEVFSISSLKKTYKDDIAKAEEKAKNSTISKEAEKKLKEIFIGFNRFMP